MKRIAYAVVTVLACGATHGQVTDRALAFEVASIKPAPPLTGGMAWAGSRGGPGTEDPTLFTCENCNLTKLTTMAYDLRPYELSGSDRLGTSTFNITAKVPPGATKEQFRVMLQNLMAERFKLKAHRETRDIPGYELVAAKNGPKLKESVEQPQANNAAPASAPRTSEMSFQLDKTGFPEVAPDYDGMVVMNGRVRMNRPKMSMAKLCDALAAQMGRPVTDATGLKEKYDVRIYWRMERVGQSRGGVAQPDTPEADFGPTLTAAVQEQLGLKLQAKGITLNMLVVDSVEKIPTEN